MKLYRRLAVALLLLGISSVAFGQDKSFDSNGVRIRYIEQGTGEPVVLIHGYTASAERNWVAPGVFAQLAKNYRVIALDCRGHGKSDKPHDPKQYGREMALDVVRLLDHLKIPKAHIVGYSMGGVITAKLLTMKPERFLSATLGGSGGILSPTEQEIKLFEQLASDMDKGSMRTLIITLTPKDQPKPTEEQLKQIDANVTAGQDTAALAAAARSLLDATITEAQVAAINVPTMAIVGSSDPLIAGVLKLANSMPKLKVVAVQGGNHLSTIGRPEFVAGIEEFLKANSMKK